nr:immunoglobulin heavy chain junction region [Mus musculus]
CARRAYHGSSAWFAYW